MKQPEPARQQFQFSDPHQKRIFKKLELVSPGAATFYKDACQLKSDSFQLESSAHLIAHLLREIESSLRAVLLPITYIPPTPCPNCGNKPEAHKKQIEKILEAYNIQPTDKIGILWK